MEFKDFLGNNISIGDTIVYTTRRGSGLDLKRAKVVEIIFSQKEDWRTKEVYTVSKLKVKTSYKRRVLKFENGEYKFDANGNRIFEEKEYFYKTTLSHPEYIVKV